MIKFSTYNDITIPSFMYGTAWKKEATADLVKLAVSSGFTAIDTANQIIHYHEALVGEALQALSHEGFKRDALFLQTKFTQASGQDHRTPYNASADITTQVRQSFDSSLDHLDTEYVDSYVLHGPYSRFGLGNADWEVWAAIEEIYQSGKAKMVGVSNVTAEQLTLLCEHANVKPMVVQNRCYAVLGWDKEVRDVCRVHNMVYQGFSLLTANLEVLRAPEIGRIANRIGVGPAQVIFRFAMQIGILPLTGTTSVQHMKEDLQVDRIELTAEDIDQIDMIAR